MPSKSRDIRLEADRNNKFDMTNKLKSVVESKTNLQLADGWRLTETHDGMNINVSRDLQHIIWTTS